MFNILENSNIKYIQSDKLDKNIITHCFTTRIGGSTPKPLDSFSMGTGGTEEYRLYVESNRQSICKLLGLENKKLVIPDQKHTANVKVILSDEEDVSNTDGLITDNPNLVLLLLFADCTPIILADTEKKIIGVIHAGWRGTAQQILKNAIEIFDKEFHSDINNIQALIGPAIGQCCYPVSNDTAEQLKKSVDICPEGIFIAKGENQIHTDLKLLNARQLAECGVKNIDILTNCTSCNNDLFYSYRADNGKTGRHAAVASIC